MPDSFLEWLRAELERAKKLPHDDRYNEGYRFAMQQTLEIYEASKRN